MCSGDKRYRTNGYWIILQLNVKASFTYTLPRLYSNLFFFTSTNLAHEIDLKKSLEKPRLTKQKTKFFNDYSSKTKDNKNTVQSLVYSKKMNGQIKHKKSINFSHLIQVPGIVQVIQRHTYIHKVLLMLMKTPWSRKSLRSFFFRTGFGKRWRIWKETRCYSCCFFLQVFRAKTKRTLETIARNLSKLP